jgi:hypothetical protein
VHLWAAGQTPWSGSSSESVAMSPDDNTSGNGSHVAVEPLGGRYEHFG